MATDVAGSATTAETEARPVRARVYYFDYLRTWATFGVVSLHAGAGITDYVHADNVGLFSRYNIGNAYDAIGRFGVGCFFMISGALLLDPAHRFRLPRQVSRVLVPLLVWSGVIVLANYVLARRNVQNIQGYVAQGHPAADTIRAIFEAPVAYHLWFVYVLIGIYLVVPLLRPLTALAAQRRGELLRYALAVWFVFAIAYPTARHLWTGLPQLYPNGLPETPSYYLGFALFGFYLHHHGVTWHGKPLAAQVYAVAALVGVTATFLLSWYAYNDTPKDVWANNNLTPQIVLFAGGVFLFAKTAFDRPGRCYPFVALFSRLSYRIYLVHVLFLHWLRRFSPLHDWYYSSPAIALAVVTVLTVAMSFVLAWLLDLVKPVRNYI